MTDARLRALERLATQTGDASAWQALVWEHVRSGQPLSQAAALVATAMANQLSRGGAQNRAEQVELDEALLRSGYFQLHYPTARLQRVWHHVYRHTLRPLPEAYKKRVHDALLRQRPPLPLSGASREHEIVIGWFVDDYGRLDTEDGFQSGVPPDRD